MRQQVKCSFCGATDVLEDRTPGEAGWMRLSLESPRGHKYLVACPAESVATVLGRAKQALTTNKE